MTSSRAAATTIAENYVGPAALLSRRQASAEGSPSWPPARTVDVQTFLNEHPFSSFQWVIFALCFCVVLLDGFDTAAIGYIAPSLITEWGVERPALAPVLSAALFGLAFGALSVGPAGRPARPQDGAGRLGAGVRAWPASPPRSRAT